MGLFSTSTVEREEKLLQKEQKNDEKAIKLALKDLDRAHKAQRKAEKAEHDAAEDHQKAIRREEKLAAELLKLQHEHESAIVTKDTLANEVAAKQEELNRLGGEVTRFQDSLEKAQERARQNGQRREKRLAELGVAVTSPTASSSADPLLVAERREVPAGESIPQQPSNEKTAAAGSTGAAPPKLPERRIDTSVQQNIPGSMPSVSSTQSQGQSPGQGFAPPPRHPVADATAPHVSISPTQ